MNDLKFAFRQLLKNPGFTAVAVLTLALGIGATSAVFDLIQGVLLTPPPYPNSERMVLIARARIDGQGQRSGWTIGQWTEWQRDARSFEAMAGYNWVSHFLILPDGNESLLGMQVTPEYFDVIGVKPLLGGIPSRFEPPARVESSSGILLGHHVWQRRFHSDSNIIGKTVRLSWAGAPLTVIGVMPPGLRLLPRVGDSGGTFNQRVDFWIPISPDFANPKSSWWSIAARLRASATLNQAQAELTAMAARQALVDHDFEGITARAQPLATELNRAGRRLLLPLLGAVALVFLIACGNVAGLLLARGLQRQPEYAVRCALGASRGRLFRQVLTESLLLALLGGVFGVGLTVGIVKLLTAFAGQAIPRLDTVSIGWAVPACCFVSALLAAGFAGLMPALRASHLDPANGLKTAGPTTSAGRSERRLLRGVVTIQTALALTLLVGAGLLIRTAINLAKVRPGYETANILTLYVTITEWSLERSEFAKWSDLHARALERISALPGVQKAAFGWGLPLTGQKWNFSFEIDGQPFLGRTLDKPSVPVRVVSPDYFETLGLAVLEGRGFRPSDRDDTPDVAIINQAMARWYFPNGNPIGKRLRFSPPLPSEPAEIVGVVADARTKALTERPEPELYMPLWQRAGAASKHLLIRTTADPRALVPIVQKELRSIEPSFVAEGARTLDQIRGDSVASQTFAMRLLVGFSLVASVLSLVGIYGLLSFSVGVRKREMAIRIAVGAQRRNILGLVLGEGVRLVTAALVLGMGVAVAFGRILRAFLFEVGPTDPATLIGMAVLFGVVALLACCFPAQRAARVDPMVALRHE